MVRYIHFIIAACLMLVAVSCEKSDPEPEIPMVEDVELYAIIDKLATKTSVGFEEEADGNAVFPVLWEKGDAIAVINSGKLYRFVIEQESENTSKGKFKIDKSVLPPFYKDGDFNPDGPLQVFYPYEGLKYDTVSHAISYYVPSEQKYRTITGESGNIDRGIFPMAAYCISAQDTICFRNLFGVLKLCLTGGKEEKLKSIEVISDNVINGEASISIGEGLGGVPDISIYISADKTDNNSKKDNKRIVLTCGEGEYLSAAKDYLIALPERTYDYGILITTTEGIYYKSISIPHVSVNPIVAGEVLQVPQLNTSEMFPAYMENGIYLGDGVVLPKSSDGAEKIVWAPVNCGYQAPVKNGGQTVHMGYPYGKLYQWGRKDGQGYKDNSYEDASYPTDAHTLGSGTPEPEKFYYDWSAGGAMEWSSDADPCPEGWRVPTNEELLSLLEGLEPNDYVTGLSAQWTISNPDTYSRHFGQPGFIFYGNTGETGGKALFLPAAGFYDYDFFGAHVRGLSGCYWSASSNGAENAWYMDFNRNGYVDSYYARRAYGRSVRCVMK